jgi:hypothetical protein
MKKELPLSLKLISGAIGKEFVIKHYKDGVVKTKYPDMSGIVASTRQRKCRNLFKEAVAYAKDVITDSERKTCWQKKLRKRNAVYNAAIQEFMLREKKAKQKGLIAANRLLRNAMMNIMAEKNKIASCVNSIEDIGIAQTNLFSTGLPGFPALSKKHFTAFTNNYPPAISFQSVKINPG